VGAALNVHEGPHSISKRYYITQPLQAGMIVSNEPGYYEDGNFGVRIENLLTIKEVYRLLLICHGVALAESICLLQLNLRVKPSACLAGN
jgi:Xaa-Pro aminopeptidase